MAHSPPTSRSLGDLVEEHPAAGPIFQSHGFDFCCGGAQDLATACAQAGLDPAAIWAQVQAAESGPGDDEDATWREQPLPALIDFLVGSYHEPLRRELPELIDMATRVERVHALHDLCPTGLAAALEEAHAAMLDHMAKEEQILFPAIRAGAGPDCDGPVTCMRLEHEEHEERLTHLRQLTHDYALPESACTTFRVLYQRLATLEEELRRHIHLENDILFPRALIG